MCNNMCRHRECDCHRECGPVEKKCFSCRPDHQVIKHQHIIKHRHDIINEYDVIHEHDYHYRDVVKTREVVKHHDHVPYHPHYCEDDCRENGLCEEIFEGNSIV